MATVSMPSDKRRRSADITTNTTLTAADQGIVQVIRSSSAFVTLPSTAASLTFTFRVGGGVVTSGPQGAAGSAVVLNISPAAERTSRCWCVSDVPSSSTGSTACSKRELYTYCATGIDQIFVDDRSQTKTANTIRSSRANVQDNCATSCALRAAGDNTTTHAEREC